MEDHGVSADFQPAHSGIDVDLPREESTDERVADLRSAVVR